MSKSTAIRTTVPYSKLRISALNSRKNRNTAAHKAKVAELAESIARVGLLQNLVVHVSGEFLDVDAGGTRYESLGLLIEDGRWPVDQEIPALIIGADEALAASYTENTKRFAMHPADEFEAFVALTTEGWTVDQIADSFGVTPLVVERRIKLQAAAPELIQKFREDELTTDQLIALCSTDNHQLQVEVWNRTQFQEFARRPGELRRAVMNNEIDAGSDHRIALVGGIEAYEKAGGTVRRDMFSDDGNGVILEDGALLQTLLFHKLEEIAEEQREAGWKWVEVWPKWDYAEFYRYGAAPTTEVVLPFESQQALIALEAELQSVADALEGLEYEADGYDELDKRQDELQEQVEQLMAQRVTYAPEIVELTGVIVAFNHNEIVIKQGLVKTEDRAQVEALLAEDQYIRGGRESKPAGRKADAVSDALRRSLLGHKNLASQMVTSTNPHAAKVLLVCELVASKRLLSSQVPTDYSVTNGWGTRTYCKITDEAGIAKEAEFEQMGKALIAPLPEDLSELWDVLYALPSAELDKLLAFAIARSVSLASDTESALTQKFVSALGLDMAAHFTPTAENYLGRVSKELIIEALDEAEKIKDDADRTGLLMMKKGALAKEAEARLVGSGWVPKLIRTEKKLEPVDSKKRRVGQKPKA